MPLNLDRADRRLMLGAGAVFLLLVIVGLLFAGNRSIASEEANTFYGSSGGAMAAYLLLQESGYNVERWRRPPDALPDPASTTLILADPSSPPTSQERSGLSQFIRNGGRVIVTGEFSGIYLPENGVAI